LRNGSSALELVLADSLYGESGDVVHELQRLKLRFIVAIRSNHSVLIALLQLLMLSSIQLDFYFSLTVVTEERNKGNC
jgi:hypothetical protein